MRDAGIASQQRSCLWLRGATSVASIVFMPTLHVRDVPHDLYEALRARAAEAGTSISAETICLLRRAMRVDLPGLRALLDEIDSFPLATRARGKSAAALIREDRDAR